MKTSVDCISCLMGQGTRICNTLNINDEKKKELSKILLQKLQHIDMNQPPPVTSKIIWDFIVDFVGVNDPYKDLKTFYNKEILDNANEIRYFIERAPDRFKAAVKACIAGNIIDFGTRINIDYDLIKQKLREVEETDLAIDDSDELELKIREAETVLILGDNCGEIVFDMLFLEYVTKEYPDVKFQYAVRGMPVINDVTREDAIAIGIDKFAEIVDTGDGTPGVNLQTSSQDFVKRFLAADVVISKGQGNFEGLSHIERENIFFLFMAKCDVVAKQMGVKKFNYICKGRVNREEMLAMELRSKQALR